MARPDEESVQGLGLEKQLNWAKDVLGVGELEKEGGRREWQNKIEIVMAEDEGKGVSSTKARDAVKRGDWEDAEALCLESVAAWIRGFSLYQD